MGQIVGQMTGFKVFKGTKQEFINSGKNTTYKDAIVFITGGTDASASCIFAQDTYFASITDLLTTINYVKGINIDGKSYNVAAGGGYIGFEASNPSEVKVNATNNGIAIGLSDAFVKKVDDTATALGSSSDAANAGGSAFARIANLAALVSDLTGGSTESIEGQIASAIDGLRTEIVGTLDDADAKTLAAINDELDAIDAKWSNYVLKSDLSTEVSDNAGTKVNVTVKTKDGKVSDVIVDETQLDTALNAKANASDVYTKIETENYVTGKISDEVTRANNAYDAKGDAAQALVDAKAYVDGKVDGKFDAAGTAAGLDAAMDARVKVLEAIDHAKLATDASAAAVATILDGAPEKFDTLKEVADWISASDSASSAADLVTRVAALEGINHDAYIAADEANLTAAKKYTDDTITGLDLANTYDAKGAADTALNSAKSYADSLVKNADGENLYDTKGSAATAESNAKAYAKEYADGLATNYDASGAAANALTEAKSYTDTEIGKLNFDGAGSADAALEAAKKYADGLAVNYATAAQGAKADAAAPQATTYTKTEVDAMWNWEII